LLASKILVKVFWKWAPSSITSAF